MTKLKTVALFLPILSFLLIASPTHASVEYEVNIAQGIQKLSEAKMEDALEFFGKALLAKPGNVEATYYSGMAYSRMGDFKKAERMFLNVIETSDTFADVHLELGRLYYIVGRCNSADKSLTTFKSMSDDEAAEKYANEMMIACREEAEEDKKIDAVSYYINTSLGSQYDSNVIVEPTNPVQSSGRKSDFNAILNLVAGRTFHDDGTIKIKGDYSLYLSKYQHLNDFDVNSHRLGSVFEFDVSRQIRPSAGYALSYTMIGGEHYSSAHKSFAKAKYEYNEKLSTELMYEYSTTKYNDSELFKSLSLKNGYKNSGGIRQTYSDDLSAGIYFYSDFERAKEEYWSYDGFRVGADISKQLIDSVYGSASAAYSERDYKKAAPGADRSRFDRMKVFSGSLTYTLTNTFSLQMTASRTLNDSNIDNYKYRRNIVGLFLTAGVS